MKCLIVHNYYQKRGGEDAVFEAESALLASRGHDVELFTMHNDAVSSYSKLGVAATTIWSGGAHKRLAQHLREFQPDIVHFHNIFPLISPSAISAAKSSGAAVVQTLHNFRLLCPSANLYRDGNICEDCLDLTVKWPAVVRSCYRESRGASAAVAAMLAVHQAAGIRGSLVDRYIALSHHSRSFFIRGGISPERIVVKPNFVDKPVAAPARSLGREGFVLYVGRLVPEKGVLTLLEAWQGADAPGVPLIIAGEGPLAPKVAAAGGMVQWVGRKSKAEIYDLMRRASLLVFPSEWYEPFGLVIVEAFANGLPVVAGRIGAAAELIDSGRTGFLFEPGNAMMLKAAVRYALESTEALSCMGKAAAEEYGAKYTPARNLNQLTDIYAEAIGANGANKLAFNRSEVANG